MKLQKGFTLIELLVVIAIIGILSSVVLASLNTARTKGEDAAIKANLSNARAQAELYYDSQSPLSYDGVCTSANGILDNVDSASSTASAAGCADSDDGWTATASLSTGVFCVDSQGAAEVVTNNVTDGATWAAGTHACSAL